MITDANPCLSPAFLGHKIDESKGEVIWSVCGWCPSVAKVPVEKEAARLGITVSHGICKACERGFVGDLLPGIASEQPTKGAA